MYLLIVALVAFLVALPASAQVAVDIGINLPAPPQMQVVAEAPSVQYIASGDANLFLYGGQYWAYSNNGWYYSSGYNGPWIGVGPEFVPQPLLIVPVNYYHRPPPGWRSWTRGRPPQWGNNYGRSWSGKREVFVSHGEPARDAHPAPVREKAAVEHAAPRAEPARAEPARAEPARAEPAREQPRPAEHAAPAAEHERPAEHEEHR
jgi:hypothetical protein